MGKTTSDPPFFVRPVGDPGDLAKASKESQGLLAMAEQSAGIGIWDTDLATDMVDKVRVAKVNIDENPQTPRKYGVRGIPTMMLFKGGQVAATKIGALPKSKLYEWVESVL